jgi:hypothetical protein
MGIGYGYPFTQIRPLLQGHKCESEKHRNNKPPWDNNSQSNSATSANTAIESLFKLMQLPEIVEAHL